MEPIPWLNTKKKSLAIKKIKKRYSKRKGFFNFYKAKYVITSYIFIFCTHYIDVGGLTPKIFIIWRWLVEKISLKVKIFLYSSFNNDEYKANNNSFITVSDDICGKSCQLDAHSFGARRLT